MFPSRNNIVGKQIIKALGRTLQEFGVWVFNVRFAHSEDLVNFPASVLESIGEYRVSEPTRWGGTLSKESTRLTVGRTGYKGLPPEDSVNQPPRVPRSPPCGGGHDPSSI